MAHLFIGGGGGGGHARLHALDSALDHSPLAGAENDFLSLTAGGLPQSSGYKASDFSASGHTHDGRYYTETEIDTFLAGKSDTGHDHDGRYYTESEVDTLLAGKSDTGHDHDDRYYTETESDTLLSGKSDTGHDHDGSYYTESEVDVLLGNYLPLVGGTMTGSIAMGDNSITGIDTLTFTGVNGTIAGIENQNLVDKTATESITGQWTIASPILVTPALGTPASGTLTNCTGLPVSAGISGLGTNVATFLITPSSANLASAVTNETGSGALVFGTSPTLSGTIVISGDLDTTKNGDHTNTMIGYDSSAGNITGGAICNTFYGNQAGYSLEGGTYNTGVGCWTLQDLTSGSNNFGMGYNSLANLTTGGQNVAIGTQSGQSLVTGSGNIFIGYAAGFSETGSNKLYIDNSSTASPLIYGDFSTNALTINGTLTSTGAVTAPSYDGLSFTEHADGFTVTGGSSSERDLKVDGSDIYIAGSGSNTYTFPVSADTLVGRASTDTFTGAKTFTTADITITDVDVVLGTTTGTQFGTATGQKQGWWGATPVVQQVLATGVGATVDNVISLLQTLGLCKQS